MKSQLIKRVISLVMTVCAGVFCTSAAGQAKLYIPDFSVLGDDPVDVDIMLENDSKVLAYSFKIEMPDELEIVDGSLVKTPRFNEGQTLAFKNNTFLTVSHFGKPFYNSYGSVGSFKVKAKVPVKGEKKVSITLKNIAISTENTADNVTLATETTTVTLTDKPDNVKLTMSVNPEEAVINPGGIQEITVAMDNSTIINGLQMTITLPEGFSLVGQVGNQFQQLPHLDPGAIINAKLSANNTLTLAISNITDNVSLNEGQGDFMSFKVQAPESFEAEFAKIQFTNVLASVYTGQSRKVNDVSLNLTNGKTAYTKAMAEIKSLEEALATALQTIENECPDVKDLFPGDEIATRIETLKSDVDVAYEELTLTADYDAIMEPVADIRAAIDSLVESAKEAQKANDDEKAAELARQEAYANANKLLEALSSSLDKAVADIADNYPDVKEYFTGEEIAASIDNMKKTIDAAYEDKTLVERYDELTAPAAEIEVAIAKLVEDAKNAQNEFEENAAAEKARLEAYKNANEVVTGLSEALNDALAEIAEACPDVKEAFQGKDITDSISAMKKAIDQALEDKSIVENYDELVAPADGIKEAIAKLVEDAKAAQKAFEDNAALETARIKALAELAELDKAFADALMEIENQCPDVKQLYTGVAIQQQITVLRNAVNAAYEDKSLADRYDEIMAPEASIADAIKKLVEDAKAAQKAIDDAEDARKKNNAEAYEADLAAIETLQNKLDAANIEIEENYPDYDATEYYNKIAAAIAALKAAADKEYENVANEGKYSYQLNTLPVETMIEDMLQEARTSGIDSIYADEVNGEYRIYTTDGKQVSKLQQGKINIIVKADGSRHKIFVK